MPKLGKNFIKFSHLDDHLLLGNKAFAGRNEKRQRERVPLPCAVKVNLFQQCHAFQWCCLFPSAVNLPGINKNKIGITETVGYSRTMRHFKTTSPSNNTKGSDNMIAWSNAVPFLASKFFFTFFLLIILHIDGKGIKSTQVSVK